MTRWLTQDEQRTWRAYLAATAQLGAALERQLQHEAGLPHAYYEILVRLSEAPGRALRMSELATSSLQSRSRLSHAVTRLEERGWVRREDCPGDRRGQLAVLTDDGFAALEGAAPGHVEAVRHLLLDGLTPEQVSALGEICTAIAARVQEVEGRQVEGQDGTARGC